MRNDNSGRDRRMRLLRQITSHGGTTIGATVLLCTLVILLFSGPLVNRFMKPRVVAALAKACPAYSVRIGDMRYSLLRDCFDLDSVALVAVDGTFSGTVGSLSVSGIAWMHLLRGGGLTPDDFVRAAVDAREIAFRPPGGRYLARCGHLRVSAADSDLVMQDVQIHPSGDDEDFFAAERFRQTRYRFDVQRASVRGLSCIGLLRGNVYRARSARLDNPVLDVLLNKDKIDGGDTVSPPMPSEVLASIEGTLQVDSLIIENGYLQYGERFVVGARPGLITLDSVQVLVNGIANHGLPGAVVTVDAQAMFMRAAAMRMHMSIPIVSPELSFRYSGSVGAMSLLPINAFVETVEQKRVKSGDLHGATFEIAVASGHASGTVRAMYRDLNFAAMNRKTGSESGIADRFTSLIARNFKIRETNMPDRTGAIKVGTVSFTRKPDETFLTFSWIALRSGIGDVVGF